jgi:peptidoglycan/LPS O-acetylase OafA/YrhL
MRRASPGENRLLPIDTLRGVAALGVFLFHVEVFESKTRLPPIHVAGRVISSVPNVISLGAYGVSLFFVISGFCLALAQWRQRGISAQMDARVYARNRFARIVPPYWVTVLVSAALTALFGKFTITHTVVHAIGHALFLHGFDPSMILSINPALWSMATEVQFYVAFPVLLALYVRVGGPSFAAIAALINLAWRGAATLPFAASLGGWAFLGMALPGRLLEFALGMCLADLYLHHRDRARPWFLPLLLVSAPVALAVRFIGSTVFCEMLFGLACFALTGLAILPRGTRDGAIGTWTAAFGRASYAFFLVHVPVAWIVRRIFPSLDVNVPHPRGEYVDYLLNVVIIFPLALAAAIALYRGVELPLWDRLRSTGKRALSPRSAAAQTGPMGSP